MQKICKTCKKQILNLVGNFCCTKCFTEFSEKRFNYLKQLVKASPEGGKHLTTKEYEEMKMETKTIFNPMESEYI